MLPFAAPSLVTFSPVKTAADWNAYLQTVRAYDGDASAFYSGNGTVRNVSISAKSGTMWGQSFGSASYMTNDSNFVRVIQHALPSEAVLDAIIANGSRVYLSCQELGSDSAFTGINRNGYTSNDYGTFPASRALEMRWFFNGEGFTSAPYLGNAPTKIWPT
jgi:hypothetical protein